MVQWLNFQNIFEVVKVWIHHQFFYGGDRKFPRPIFQWNEVDGRPGTGVIFVSILLSIIQVQMVKGVVKFSSLPLYPCDRSALEFAPL